ncbi:MAG: hypothetical protein JXA72_07300 [Bacteroidales bacterium]|nr:hypothetical protein [Bacteroidales bacterium]
MPVRIAFAVNQNAHIEARHFGDADKYIIGEYINKEIVLIREEMNTCKTLDEHQEHGAHKKGLAIIELLKKNQVNILVSRQFGKNVQIVNRHFIQVIVDLAKPEEAIPHLTKHMKHFEDELVSHPAKYTLFTIKKGKLKEIIIKD